MNKIKLSSILVLLVFYNLLNAQQGTIIFNNTSTLGTNSIGPHDGDKSIRINGEKNVDIVIDEEAQYSDGAFNIFRDAPSASPLFQVTRDGNVGIGKNAATAKVDINGSLEATQYITVKNGGSYRVALNAIADGYLAGRNVSLENKFRIHSNGSSWLNGGYVGFGTTTPDRLLDVTGGDTWQAKFSNGSETKRLYVGWYDSRGAMELATWGDGIWESVPLHILPNTTFFAGNVGIGSKNPDSKLTVKGNIHAEEVKVDLSVPGPDYVFKEDYDLNSLEEVQNYINENGHLPNIPSAKEMEEQGIQLGEMNMKLLEKIEELTLYIIQLEEKTERMVVLENRLKKIEKHLNTNK